MNEDIRKNAEINEDALESIAGGDMPKPVRKETYRACPRCGKMMILNVKAADGRVVDVCRPCGAQFPI